MKRKNGFTLIELLAVILILGILVSITTVSVNSIRKKQEEKNRENVISSILTGAKEYNAKNPGKMNAENKVGVKVSTLKGENFVDFDEKKYNDLMDERVEVTFEPCTTSEDEYNLKRKFIITVGNKTYNDCGCEGQVSAAEDSDNSTTEIKSKTLCTN